MKLEFTCSGCKKQNNFKPVTTTRGDLQMKVGDEVQVNCMHCGKFDKKHINRIDAVVDNKKILFAVLISAVATIGLWLAYSGVATVTFIIPLVMWIQESKSASNFNSYKIRRR